jgi:hypothetical protein
MKEMKKALGGGAWIAGVAVMYAGWPAHAIVVIEQDHAAFMSQLLPGHHTEDFEGFTGGQQPASIPRSANDFSYTLSAPNGLFINQQDFKFSQWLSIYDANDAITVTFTGPPVTAVGGNFFLTLFFQETATAGTFIVQLNDGTQHVVSSLPESAGAQPFVGFLSTDPITSLTVLPPGDPLEPGVVTMDNLVVGTAIPEPGEMAIVAAVGLAGLGAFRWRRTRRTAVGS